MHRRLLAAACTAVALAAVVAPLACATEPTRRVYEDAGTGWDPGPICPFPVAQGWENIGTETLFYDRYGSLVKIDLKFHGTVWFTANGRTVAGDWAHSNITVYGPYADSWADGGRSMTARTSGARLRLPDGRPTAQFHGGRLTVDNVTGEVTATPGFVYPADFTEACAYLAP